jgi:Protein of unknown function (DUF3606)
MRRVNRTRGTVDVLRRRELAYWTSRWGVTVEDLRMAVFKVGSRIDRVAEELGKEP